MMETENSLLPAHVLNSQPIPIESSLPVEKCCLEGPLQSALSRNPSVNNTPNKNPEDFKKTRFTSPTTRSPLHDIIAKRVSSTGSICRICHEGESMEDLISPCQCTGTLGLVHLCCIERWLSTSNSDVCEICGFHYVTYRQKRPAMQWITSRDGPKGLYGDLICLLVLTPLCLISVYLCGLGSIVYLRQGMWEGTGLAVLCVFLLVKYVAWCFITARYHWKSFQQWSNTNQIVHLIETSREAAEAKNKKKKTVSSSTTASSGTSENECETSVFL